MPGKVIFIQELNVVETIIDGSISMRELKEVTIESLKLAMEHGTQRFLVDCSKLKHGGSIMQLYSIGALYLNLNVDRGMKQAVILPDVKELQKNLRFYETATRNRGFDVRVFDDRFKAIAWLVND